jgi:hypothetical protein
MPKDPFSHRGVPSVKGAERSTKGAEHSTIFSLPDSTAKVCISLVYGKLFWMCGPVDYVLLDAGVGYPVLQLRPEPTCLGIQSENHDQLPPTNWRAKK